MRSDDDSRRRAVLLFGLFLGFSAALLPVLGAGSKFPEIGPLPPVPVPADNPMTPEKVELGKLLFFDVRLAGDLNRPCLHCHNPEQGWSSGFDLADGFTGTRHWRNSPTIINAAYYTKHNWDGSQPSLESQAAGAIESAVDSNSDPLVIEERLAQSLKYVQLFKDVFGAVRPTYGDLLKAIAAFERTLVSRNVPFDKYMRGDKSAISAAAVRGMALFKGKAKCIYCHNGPLFSDQDFHATGVPENPIFQSSALWQITLRYQHAIRGVPEEVYRDATTDLGLYYVTKRDEDRMKFRTQSLRETRYSAPYMHNGVFDTLEQVVDFYNKGGGKTINKTPLVKPLGLKKQEKKDLLAFLDALSGDEILIESPQIPPYNVVNYNPDPGKPRTPLKRRILE